MKFCTIMLSFLLFVISCSTIQSQTIPDNINISSSPNGVVPLPSTVPAAYSAAGFVKYTKIIAPNGQAIHFIAQNALTDAQIVRARNILNFYLTNIPNSQYGANKAAVMNAMGNNEALLMLLNGSDNGNPPAINGQPLYQEEIAVEGHTWYQNNDYNDHRDASFEEILHLMHDFGIGVDNNGTPSPIGALPAYQAEIRAAQQNALTNTLWGMGDPAWITELTNENSLSQEYLASVVDSYYGLWGAWQDNPTNGMWGLYISKTRAEIQTEDPMGWALMPKYFSPYININMDIDPSFTGTFVMNFDSTLLYTHKSQYLQHCTLTGTNNANLKGNDIYNRLNGNNGNNELEGGKGNDRLNGNGGTDIAKFTGNSTEYTISTQNSMTIVEDNIANRDGVDTLWGIESIQFSNQTIATNLTLVSPDIALKVYPNPVKDYLLVEWDTPIFEEGSVELLNALGQVILVQKFITDTSTVRLNVRGVEAGTYLVKVLSNNKLVTQHVLIK